MKLNLIAFFLTVSFAGCNPFSESENDSSDGKEIGGIGLQEGRSAVQTEDGYLVAGFDSTQNAGYDVYLIKLNNKGDVIREKRYGGSGTDYGRWIGKTSDGHYIVCGSTSSFGSDNDVYLLKVKNDGDTIWTAHYDLGASESGYCLREEPGGNFVIVGNQGNDMLLAKINPEGQLLWYKTFGGSDEDQGECMLINPAGEYILLGETHSFGLSKSDFFIVKTDADGNEIWNRHYGGSGYNHGFSIDFAPDSGYILAGTTHQDMTSEGRATFMHLLDNGDTLWTKLHKGWQANVRSICRSGDGNFMFTGWERDFPKTIYLAKLDPYGEIAWKQGIPYTFAWSKAYSVIPTIDNGYLITGTKGIEAGNTDVAVIKTSSKGNFKW